MSYTVASIALTSNARCLAASIAASSSCMICARRGAAPSAPREHPRAVLGCLDGGLLVVHDLRRGAAARALRPPSSAAPCA